MKLEHVAVNVKNPVEFVQWYVTNLGMKVIRKQDEAPFTHFIADDSGRVMLEVYNNPADQVPAYSTMDPLIFHLAFVSESPVEDKNRLIAAGATFHSEVLPGEGSHLIMMRDPWGLAVQLCKRSSPMLLDKEV